MNEPHILVVDDEPAIRRTLRANLAARGYEVSTVETGEEALHHAAARLPNLVILDLMLPGLSGLEVCRALRAIAAVPILVLSARGEERTKVQALDLGTDDYISPSRSAWMSCWPGYARCCAGQPAPRRRMGR